jgi:hypothetical protein
MNVVVSIPDELAARIAATGDSLERRALEALVVEEFRAGRISKAELRRALGLETRGALDGFLKARGVYDDYSVADFENEQQALDKLGL